MDGVFRLILVSDLIYGVAKGNNLSMKKRLVIFFFPQIELYSIKNGIFVNHVPQQNKHIPTLIGTTLSVEGKNLLNCVINLFTGKFIAKLVHFIS